MKKKEKINKGRRRFLKFGLAVGGMGLALGVYFKIGGEHVKSIDEIWSDKKDAWTPNVWLCINRDGTILVRINHTELGQGIRTSLAMIVAEELEADWSLIRTEIAPVESVYKNPEFNTQMTAASTSVRTSYDILRHAGAVAREMLTAAAAQTWKVPVSECRAFKATVVHDPSSRAFDYAELIDTAANLPTPEKVALKNQEEFTIIGQNIGRVDAQAKVDGSAVFGIDVQLPGMLIAGVVHPPVFGAGIKSYNSAKAKTLPGVRHVLDIGTGIVVIADTFWQAQKGIGKLEIEWESPATRIPDSADLEKHWASLSNEAGKTVFEKGEMEKAWEKVKKIVSATYEVPFQGHATPEPMNCTAHVQTKACDVWAPTQNQDAAQEIAAKIAGLPYESVRVQTTCVGGGFGRRVAVDYVAEAVSISKLLKAPIKVIWTREEDMQHDFYRPASLNVFQAGLDSRDRPITWTHRIIGPDHMSHALPRLLPGIIPYGVPRTVRNMAISLAESLLPRIIAGKKAIEGAAPLAYDIGNVKVDYVRDDPGVPLGFWRSVAHSSNAFVVECFIDEIAEAARMDPYDLRVELLQKMPLLLDVLKLVAQKAGWKEKSNRGTFHGIAAHDFHGTMLACVAEISVNDFGIVIVKRIVCAVDCGCVINPRIVESQIEGGLVFGLSATLKSAITIREGRVEQSNFDDFPILQMDEMPKTEVYIIPSRRPPTGIGEAAVPMIAPAVANAVFAATGKRIRKLPIQIDE